ncbi:deoxyribose-phosphate aldolase [Propionibacteriaceae bacterium G1746]|uniref:deoxyribose-phosphate aldolase n=1 Tax=Aestuariimicrobium sp. G57 TaxID=3418485 RepID=UPI003C1E5FBF
MTELTRAQVAQMIDHTLLKPAATPEQVAELIAEAAELGTYSVCISPSLVPVETPDSVKLAVVCGFPSGAHKPEVKAAEAAAAQADGVDEIDMVINLAWAVANEFDKTEAEIRAVREAAPDVLLKVIIESAALTDEQIVGACEASERAGADFVKTSTGFHAAGGASVEAVALMAKTVGGRLGVKASGGIRDAETARAMIEAGATRLGLSSSKAVLDGFPA